MRIERHELEKRNRTDYTKSEEVFALYIRKDWLVGLLET